MSKVFGLFKLLWLGIVIFSVTISIEPLIRPLMPFTWYGFPSNLDCISFIIVCGFYGFPQKRRSYVQQYVAYTRGLQ